jgi:hypothetical protein
MCTGGRHGLFSNQEFHMPQIIAGQSPAPTPQTYYDNNQYTQRFEGLYNESVNLDDAEQRRNYIQELDDFAALPPRTEVAECSKIHDGVFLISEALKNNNDEGMLESGLWVLRDWTDRNWQSDPALAKQVEEFLAYIEQDQFGKEPKYSKKEYGG